MIPITPDFYLEAWYLALKEELGIKFEVDPDDVHPIMARFYDARKDVNDPRLAVLSIHVEPDGRTFWIYRNTQVELT